MIRIEQPKSVVVHDGLDVSVVDGVVTVRQSQANAPAAEVAELERLERMKAFKDEGAQAHDAVLSLQMAEHERLQRLNEMGYAAFSQPANQSISDIAHQYLSGLRQKA